MCTYTDKTMSPGKRAAREFVGKWVKRRKSYIIVIVGWEERTNLFQCGDIPYFQSLGFSPDKIIACGVGCVDGLTAGEWASKTYGAKSSPYPLIEDTVRWAIEQGYSLALINVDLCGSVKTTGPILRNILDVLPVYHNAVVALTYYRGRDGLGLSDVNKLQYPNDDIDRHRNNWLELMCNLPAPSGEFHYQSATFDANGNKLTHGSPMCVNIYLPKRKSQMEKLIRGTVQEIALEYTKIKDEQGNEHIIRARGHGIQPGDQVEVSFTPQIRKMGTGDDKSGWITVEGADGRVMEDEQGQPIKVFSKGKLKMETATKLRQASINHGGYKDSKMAERVKLALD